MTITPNFFDYGETVLLLHCKNSTNYIQTERPDTKGTLEPARLECVKDRQRRKPNLKHSQQSRQLSFTELSNYCSSRNGRVESVVRKHKFALHDSGRGLVVDCTGFLVSGT